MNIEIWKDIPDYEGFYQVSNWGHVKGLDRIVRNYPIKGRLLALSLKSNGYYRITLCKRGTEKYFYVHELVAKAFIGERPKGMEINHIDGVRTNNHLDNLEYVTPKQNGEHATKTGLTPKGERHYSAKLTAEKVLAIRAAYANGGITHKELGKQYQVTREAIREIIRRKNWKHI